MVKKGPETEKFKFYSAEMIAIAKLLNWEKNNVKFYDESMFKCSLKNI